MGFNNNNNTILSMGGREPREHMPLIFFKGGGGGGGGSQGVHSCHKCIFIIKICCCFVAYVFLEHLTHRIKAIARESTFFLWSH